MKKDFKYDDERIKNFIIDFLGIVLYPIHENLKEIGIDIKKEIMQRGGSVDTYIPYEEEWVDSLSDELIHAIEEFTLKQGDIVDFGKEKIALLNILEKSFLRVLETDSFDSLNLLNNGISAVLHNVQGFQKEAVDALLRNQEPLSVKEFFLGDKAEKPTIGNWLKDFISQRGSGDFDSLDLSEYLSVSRNVKTLDPREKNLLEKLLIIYRNFKFFVLSGEDISAEQSFIIPIGIAGEEPIKLKTDVVKKLYETQALEEKMPRAQDNDTANQILDAYRGDVAQEAKVVATVGDMKKKFGQDIQPVRDAFFDAVRNSDIIQAMATLRILAERDDIQNLLFEDEKLKKFLIAIWEKSYGKDFALEFQNNPQLPKFMSKFLQYVLEERLVMPGKDAARFGAQIGGIYKKLGKPQYAKMAYFDMEHKEFKWL